MKHFFINILMILQLSLFAQGLPDRPYEKLIFPNIIPQWYSVNYDSEMDADKFDGFNNFIKLETFEHLIYDDAIYELYYRQNTNEPTGTYVQKRDLRDGTLIWRKYIGYPSDPKQILGRNLFINSNENLEVIFQVKCDPYDPMYPLLGRKNMALYKIEFDVSDGQVLDQIDYHCNDTTYLQTNFDLFYLNSVSRFYGINNKFYFSQGEWTGSKWQYVIFKLEDDFKATEIFAKRFPKKYICFGDLPIFFNDSTKIVFNSNCVTKRIEMTYIDNEFNPIKTVISDSLSNKLNELQVKKFDPIRRRFLLENVINFDTQEIELLIIDDNGKLLKRIIMPPVYNRAYGLLEWDNIDYLTFLAPRTRYTGENRPYVSLDVLKSDFEGKIDIQHSFTSTDSLRYIAYSSLVGSDSEHYYLEFNESSLKKTNTGYSLDRKASAVSMMKISKQQILNPISSTNQSTVNQLKCYPNPTSEFIRIDGLSQPTTISIIDINGRTVKVIKNVVDQINIQYLPSGMYILDIKNKEISERHKIIKIE